MDGFEGKTAGRAALTYPHGDTVPGVGKTMEVAPDVFWVRMPLPFSLQWINLWLIDDGPKGWTIVDTGYYDETCKATWEKVFTHFVLPEKVKRIVVTH